MQAADPYEAPGAPPGPSPTGDVWRGVLLGLGLDVFFQAAVWALHGVDRSLPLMSNMLVGLSQLVYLLPAALILHARGRHGVAKGLWILMGVTFLLNAAICGMLITSSGL